MCSCIKITSFLLYINRMMTGAWLHGCFCPVWKGCIPNVFRKPSEAGGLPVGQSGLQWFSSYTGRHTPVFLSSSPALFLTCGILACCSWKTDNHMTCPTYNHCSSLLWNHRLYNVDGHMPSVKYVFQSHSELCFHRGTLGCNFYGDLEEKLWQMCDQMI